MKPHIKKQSLYSLLMFFILFTTSVFAQDTSFHRVELAYGISLDIPSNWVVLSQDSKKNIAVAGEAMLSNAGIEGSSGQKERLLAVNAQPESNNNATIRVSVTMPPDYTQADIAIATPKDLEAIGFEMQKLFKTIEVSGGIKIIEMQPVHIEKFNNFLSLVMPYVRAGVNDSVPWQVTQYKIPVSNRLIEITFSYKQTDALVLNPILERVKSSVQF
ncbi:hypothetical protein BCS42_14210 [Crenothrix sp. D3]|nr:hypothetical protein BCS42_14210 [Crenothrix sp. D3]